MKRLAFGWLMICGLTALAAAQSGRIKPDTTPTPAVILASSNKGATNYDVSDEQDYSESAPGRARSTNYNPVSSKAEKNSGKTDKKSKKRDKSDLPEIISTDDGEVLKVETNLISIPVSVFDRQGLYIPNLQKSDFRIFEDGKEQEVAYFGTAEKPFTVILLLDTSPSTAYKIEEIQRAATAFVDQLKMQDSVMVIEFDGNVHVLTETTNNRDKIYKAIRKADFGSGTSLYEAVDFSLRKRLSKIEGRKAIVLFTDGVDTTSDKADFYSTIHQAEESEAMIFPIYYNTFTENLDAGGIPTTGTMRFPAPGGGIITNPRGTRREDYELGRKYLDELAESTGGRIFTPDSTAGGLTAAFEGIAEELRRQYNIGYYPTGEGEKGQRKQIKVRVNRPKLVVRARDSYIVGATN